MCLQEVTNNSILFKPISKEFFEFHIYRIIIRNLRNLFKLFIEDKNGLLAHYDRMFSDFINYYYILKLWYFKNPSDVILELSLILKNLKNLGPIEDL